MRKFTGLPLVEIIIFLALSLTLGCTPNSKNGGSTATGSPCADGTAYGQCASGTVLLCQSSGLVEDRFRCGNAGSLQFSPTVKAAQTIFQDGAAHTNRYGTPMKLYGPGQSFFPIWMYGMKHPKTAYLCHPDETQKMWRSASDPRTTGISILKDGGFNTAQYWGTSLSQEDFFADAVKNNFQAMMYWQPFTESLTAPANADIRGFIERNAEHPNLLGWMLTEETGGYLSTYLTPARPTTDSWISFFLSLKNEFKARSTRPLFHIENLWVANQTETTARPEELVIWNRWNDPSDIIIIDIYPEKLSTIQTLDTVNGLTRAGKFVRDLYVGTKPYWVMLGAFELEPAAGQPKTMEMPTPKQMRALAYTAVVHGATGLGYFLMDDYASRKAQILGVRPDTPTKYLKTGYCSTADWSNMLEVSAAKAQQSRDVWAAIVKTNSELQALAPALLSYTTSYYYRVDIAQRAVSEAPIRTMLKEAGGYFYLLAVNVDRAKVTASFLTEIAAASASTVEVMFEGRTINLAPSARADAASFVDEFDEFDVHVYRWPVKRVSR